jgi:hypothetical protein
MLTEWFVTVPFVAVGVPALPVGIAATVTAPVVNLPEGTAVCTDVVGVMVTAACVFSWSVLLPLTVMSPAVPLDTYPADTLGVTLCVLLMVAVTMPVEFCTESVGGAVILVAGVVALPLGIAFICTLDSPS